MKTTIDSAGNARRPRTAVLPGGRVSSRVASIGRAALVAVAFCVATAPSPSFADTVTADAALAAAKGWVNLR